MANERTRVAVIGVDALQLTDLEHLVDRAVTPNIGKFLAGARVAQLGGETAYRAESVWTEFFSGRRPAESRYWTTVHYDPATYDTHEVAAYRGAPFYNRPDIDPVVIDLPHVPIAPDAGGIQVTGWGAHSPQFPTASQPSDVIVEIDRRFGVHAAPLSDSNAGWHNEAYHSNLAAALIDGAARKPAIISWLLDRNPSWNLLIGVFSESHVAGHHYYHGIDPAHPLHRTEFGRRASHHFDAVLAAADAAIGELIATLPDDVTVLLTAAHGMRSNGSDVTGGVLVPELLFRRFMGRPLLDFRGFDPTGPPIVLPERVTPADYLQTLLTEPRSVMGRLSRRGAVARDAGHRARQLAPSAAQWLERGLWSMRGDRTRSRWWDMQPRRATTARVDVADATRRKPLDYQVPCWYRRWWPAMDVFALPSFSDAQLRVNLAGRERSGTVPAEDYEQTLASVEADIRAARDSRTGRPIVEDVARPRAADPLDPDGATADLVVSFAGVSDAITHPELGTIGPAPLMRSGEHTATGWVAMQHRDPAHIDALGARAADLAPTIVQLLGLPESPVHTGTSLAEQLA